MTSPTPVIPLNVQARVRFRRAWSQEWQLVNPVLRDGEPGYDKTKNMLKMGDGVTPWNDLSYLTPPEAPPVIISGEAAVDSAVTAAVSAHVNDTTPHPVYDEGPSLLLLWQNAKV